MSIEIKAYKCKTCGDIYEEKIKADNCCKCTKCKHYIGRFDRKSHWVHCVCGYTCDSYSSSGKEGTYNRYEGVF